MIAPLLWYHHPSFLSRQKTTDVIQRKCSSLRDEKEDPSIIKPPGFPFERIVDAFIWLKKTSQSRHSNQQVDSIRNQQTLYWRKTSFVPKHRYKLLGGNFSGQHQKLLEKLVVKSYFFLVAVFVAQVEFEIGNAALDRLGSQVVGETTRTWLQGDCTSVRGTRLPAQRSLCIHKTITKAENKGRKTILMMVMLHTRQAEMGGVG